MQQISALNVGESLPDIELSPVSRLDLIKYAGASGDYNPIHTIDSEAEKAGLPGIIAHGMWTMGHLSKLFTPYIEDGFVQKFTTRFSGMVFLDDVVSLRGKLTEVDGDDLHFDVQAVNQKDKAVLKGHITFRLYS